MQNTGNINFSRNVLVRGKSETNKIVNYEQELKEFVEIEDSLNENEGKR
jgi:hypothetical protein